VSRIGKRTIGIPPGVQVQVQEGVVEVKGPKGTLRRELNLPNVEIAVRDGTVAVTRSSESKKAHAAHGLVRMLIANMVQGVSEGYRETMVLVGVGYRAQLQGNVLHMTLGYSHPVRVQPPDGIHLEVEGTNRIIVSGADKEQLGAFVAYLKSLRPMSRYGYAHDGRGKGVKKESERPRFRQRRQTAA